MLELEAIPSFSDLIKKLAMTSYKATRRNL